MVLFTDGVVEERAEGVVFGIERLMSVVGSAHGQDAAGIADAIDHAVLSFSPQSVRDDVAVLVMRVRP